MPSNTLCVECAGVVRQDERASMKGYAANWIAELQLKRLLCTDGGWYPWTPRECREWFVSSWPNYTPQKGLEQIIYELQLELGMVPTVPRHVNLCPCTTEQGKAVNAKFEELAAT
jgi:hypothetical protein